MSKQRAQRHCVCTQTQDAEERSCLTQVSEPLPSKVAAMRWIRKHAIKGCVYAVIRVVEADIHVQVEELRKVTLV